ncbi:MAG: SDR family NAD(P)-dependent oxidoreductase [Rubricoccaceae bacterium]
MLLQDKRIVITGGAGGIGRAMARHFLEHGARLLLTDLKDEALEDAAGALGHEDRVFTVAADVTGSEDNRRIVEAAREHLGGIDVFCANAGVEGVVKPLTEYPEDTWDLVQAVNVKGVWLGLKYAFPVMAEGGGGSVIVTSSVAGLQGNAQMSAYTTSKHAVIGLARTAAIEGAPHGIRVNCINPGPVDNRMMRALESGMNADDPESVKEGFSQMIPLGRYAEEDDVARAALYFASDLSAYVTGTVHPVDGGLSA